MVEELGLIETMLRRGGEIRLLDAHLARLLRSAEEVGIPRPDVVSLREELARLGSQENEECAVRIELDPSGSWKIDSTGIPPTSMRRREGCHLISLPHSFRRSHPRWKSTDRSVCIEGMAHAVERGGNEALFVDADGHALEGTVTNVFLVDADGVLRTAPADGAILPGVMRAAVIRCCGRAGIELIEERFDAALLGTLPAFVTSSLTIVAPIVSFNGKDVPQSPKVQKIREAVETDG